MTGFRTKHLSESRSFYDSDAAREPILRSDKAAFADASSRKTEDGQAFRLPVLCFFCCARAAYFAGGTLITRSVSGKEQHGWMQPNG